MPRRRPLASALAALLFFVAAPLVSAHRPLLTGDSCDGDYGSSNAALPIPDPSISWAFKHYADCTRRAVWASFVNPSEDFVFYVGVGVPPVERFADVRANALIIGPGLPKLTDAEWTSLPAEVREDPIWEANPEFGAYYHVAPQDQSTCDHLGSVMKGESTVRNGRCDFYEPFGQTHSWRVLDADDNVIPVEGATYHVAVFLQENVSSKFGVALGTWVENFVTRYDIDTPSCTRDLGDFSEEKNGLQEECFPMIMCDAVEDDEEIGCVGEEAATAEAAVDEVCELGRVCADSSSQPSFLDHPMMGSCTYESPWSGPSCLQFHGDAWTTEDMMARCAEENESAFGSEGCGDSAAWCDKTLAEGKHEASSMALSAMADCSVNEMACEAFVQGTFVPGSECMTEGVESGGDCVVAGIAYEAPKMGACGGERCPAAVKSWETVNMKMHEGMMDLDYTGDAEIDFVRGMIPHHTGAVHMCDALMELTCTEASDIDSLEGLEHLCNHIRYEQGIEVAGMLKWLEERGLEVTAPCPVNIEVDITAISRGGHAMTGMDHSGMPESCGATNEPTSEAFIKLNHKMMAMMSVAYSCDHPVDFVRQMIPHHAAAIEMCDTVVEATDDAYLVELCGNITHTQRAEINWMYDWLKERDVVVAAPCDATCDASQFMQQPCEDLLSTSSFCHGLTFGQDGYCRCDDTLEAEGFSCDSVSYVDGVGVFMPFLQCKRTCGFCGMDMEMPAGGMATGNWGGRALMRDDERPIWPHSCYEPMAHMHGHDGEEHTDMHHNMGHSDMHHDMEHHDSNHDMDHTDMEGEEDMVMMDNSGGAAWLFGSHVIVVAFSVFSLL